MSFRTELHLNSSFPFSLEKSFFCMGSCFADNISGILQSYRLPTCVNPFGITYNPLSIASSLQRLLDQRPYTKEELIKDRGIYLSLDHHGDFSDSLADACLQKINQSFEEAQRALQDSTVMILTLGTAFVYHDKETDQVVNNCHRLAASRFERSLLKSDEIVAELGEVLKEIVSLNPKLQILISVSPIRHLRDSFPQNTLSKSQLIAAAHELEEGIEQVEYLPIYELMMDDLRDYRFYEADMIHPNKTAIDYIWQKFSRAYFDAASHQAFKRIDKLNQMLEHRPRNTEGEDYQKFLDKKDSLQKSLEQTYPFLNW